MRYSCFDFRSGQYRVYDDGAGYLPVNGDLPMPALPPDINGIGVPATLAGRALPSSARFVGMSSQAQGIVVACPQGTVGAYSASTLAISAVFAVAGLALFWWWSGSFRS
jgi:hypothetical protein